MLYVVEYKRINGKLSTHVFVISISDILIFVLKKKNTSRNTCLAFETVSSDCQFSV